MRRNSDRILLVLAVLGWIGVGAYGVWETRGTEGDWESSYSMFSIALLVAVVCSVALAWRSTQETERPMLRRVGPGVGVIASLGALVAWAVPLWATLLAFSVAVSAVAAPRRVRPGLVTLALAQLVGMVVMIAAIESEFGRQDSYGDYPAAFGLGTLVIAVGSILGLGLLARARTSARSEHPIAVSLDAPLAV